MTDLAALSFTVDASQAAAATKVLNDLTAAAGRADAAAKGLGTAQAATAKASADATGATEKHQASIAKEVQTMMAATQAMRDLTAQLAAMSGGYNKQRDESEKAARAAATFERSVNALIGRLDPLAGATIKTAAATDTLNRAVAAGLITRQRANELTVIATRRHNELAEAQAKGAAGGTGMVASIRSVGASLSALNSGLATVGVSIGVAFAVREIVQWTNAVAKAGTEFQMFAARIGLIVGPGQAAINTMDALFQSAQRTGVAFESTIGLFQRVGNAARDMGATSSEVLRLTETVQKLGRIGGGSVTEVNGALVQLGQALASGRLGGDELRSILEGMPMLARAIAEGLGVGVGRLREMGAAGQLTADKVFGAILASSKKADEQFAKLPMTMQQAGTALENAWSRALASLDKSVGLSEKLAALMKGMADIAQSVDRSPAEELAVQLTQIDKLIAKRREYQALVDKPASEQAKSILLGDRAEAAAQLNASGNLEATNREIAARQLAAAALAKQIEKQALLTEQQELGERATAAQTAITKKMTDGITALFGGLNMVVEAGKVMTKEQVTLAKATAAVEEAIKRGGSALDLFGGSADRARGYLKMLAEAADPIAKQIKDITNAAESAAAIGGADKYRIGQSQAFKANPANTGKDPAEVTKAVEDYIAAQRKAAEVNATAAATFARLTAAAGDNGAALTAVSAKQAIYGRILELGTDEAAALYLTTGKLPAGFEAIAKSIGTAEWSKFNAEMAKTITNMTRTADGAVAVAAASAKGNIAIADAERAQKAHTAALGAGGVASTGFANAYAKIMEQLRRGDVAAATTEFNKWVASQDAAIASAWRLADAEKDGAEAVRLANIENAIAAEIAKSKIPLDEKQIKVIRDTITSLSDLAKQTQFLSAMRSKGDELQIAEAELRLVNALPEARARELASIKAVIDAKNLSLVAGTKEYDQYVALATAVEETKLKTQEATKQRDLWLEPFKNAIQGIQAAFSDAFEKIFSGGVKSFADLGKTVLTIMVKMAAQIAALMIFQPVVGNVLSAAGASPSMIQSIVPGFAQGAAKEAGSSFFSNPLSSISNLFSSGNNPLATMMPSLFGPATGGYAGIGLAGGVEGAMAGGTMGAAAGPLAAAGPYIMAAMAAVAIASMIFKKKPSVGPNANATVGFNGNDLGIVDSGADNGGNKDSATELALASIKAFKKTVSSIGGEIDKSFGGLQVGYFKNKFFVDDTRMGGSATYEANQFEKAEDAIADFVVRAMKSGKVNGISDDMKAVLKNTEAKTIEDLGKDMEFGRTFRDQIALMNAGIGTLAEQTTKFTIASKEAAMAEADRVKTFIETTEKLFGKAGGGETTRSITDRVSINRTSGENVDSVEASIGGKAYSVISEGVDGAGKAFMELRDAAGAVSKAFYNAETRAYEVTRTVTETTPGTEDSEQLRAARAAVKNNALAQIGLGPDGTLDGFKPMQGAEASFAAEVERIKAWQKVLEAAGFTVAEATAKVAEAIAKTKAARAKDMNEDLDKAIAIGRNDTAKMEFYALEELEKQRQLSLKDAIALGADTAKVEELYGLKRLEIQEAFAKAAAEKAAANNSNLAAAMRLEGDELGAMMLELATNAETRRREARAAGLDMVLVERLIAAERKKAMEELGKAQAAKETARVTGNAGMDSTLLRLSGRGRDADLMDFDVANVQRRKDAKDAGLDLVKLETVIAAERAAIIKKYAEESLRVVYDGQLETLNTQLEAQEKLRDAAERTYDSFMKIADSLDKARLALRTGVLSPFSGEQRLSELKNAYESTRALARTGDEKAMGELGDVATKYAEFAKSYFGGNAEYAAIFNEIDGSLKEASDRAKLTASIAKQQLDAAKTQVDLLTQARDSLALLVSRIGAPPPVVNNSPAPGATPVVGGAAFDSLATRAESYISRSGGDLATSEWGGLVSERQSVIRSITDTSELVRILYQYYGGRRTAEANGDMGAVEIVARLRELGVPGYAGGGMFGGGLRVVGERGPEIEATGPARYWDAGTTASMLRGGSNDNNAVVDRLERIERAVNGQTNVIAKSGDMNADGHNRTAAGLEEIKRKSDLAAAA